jgi:hypothetical protein
MIAQDEFPEPKNHPMKKMLEEVSRLNKMPRSMQKTYRWGLLTLVVLSFKVVIWPSSEAGLGEAERFASASALSNSEPNSASHNQSNSRVRAQQRSSVNTKKQPLENFLAAQALEDPLQQQAAFEQCMEGMTPQMARSLLNGFDPENLKGAAAQRLFDHWATTNPRDAAAWAQCQGDPETCRCFLTVAALRWAAIDLKEAAAWGQSLPEGSLQTEIMTAMASEAVRADPVEALRLAADLPISNAQSDLVCRAAAEWALSDLDSVLTWTGQIKDENLKQRVIEEIAVASADQDSAGAAQIVLEQMSPGMGQDRAIVSIVQRMVQTDPAGASAWVSQFPNDSLGVDSIDNLVNLWAKQDPAAPSEWLLTLPEGALRNAGALAYSHILKRTDAELAERWTQFLTRSQ